MIVKDKGQVRLEFGSGDICVAGGYTNNEDSTTGFVIFTNQEPRIIGNEGIIKTGEVNLEYYPIIMTFSKKESVDVVIGQLEQAKSFMD